MEEIREPKIIIESSKDGNEGKITVEPLERGYGITIGNSMRRVLNTALPGVAIVGIKVKGVLHEFSTIEGVREDVVDIILNLKEVAIKVVKPEEYPNTILRLVKDKPGIVTAGDIQTPGGVEIANKEAYICTLGEKATLDIELHTSFGRGYKSAQHNKNVSAGIGYIPIDALFSPVKSAKYEVSGTRVEQSMDFDKLQLYVTTNGAISVKEVVSKAANLLNEHLKLFIDLVEGAEERVFKPKPVAIEDSLVQKTPIEELDLTVRPLNCLKRAGINHIEDLLNMTRDQLSGVKNLGEKSLLEIEEKLGLSGKSLRIIED